MRWFVAYLCLLSGCLPFPLVASDGAVRLDILNFSEPAGARKFRIESELRSGREERGQEWIQLRAGVSLERVAEARRALSR